MVSRLDGAVTAPESDLMVKFVVEATFAPEMPNDFAPAPRNSTLLSAFVPMKLEISCSVEDLFKMIVPPLCVNVPEFRIKSLPTVSTEDGATTVPRFRLNTEVVVAAFAPKVHEPPVPLKVRPLNGDEVATMLFC